MKTVVSILMASMLLFAPACTISTNAPAMTDEQAHASRLLTIRDASTIAGILLKKEAKPSTVEALKAFSTALTIALEQGQVTMPETVAALMDRYSEALVQAGVDQTDIQLIKSVTTLIDNAIGGVRFSLEGGASSQKDIVLAIVQGLELGLR